MKKGLFYIGFVLVITFIFMKFGTFFGDKALTDGFNGYWSPKNSEVQRDFYFKGNKMVEMDSEGNETTYKLIDTVASYEIDPSSITDSSFFAGTNTVEVTNSGDVQYFDIDYGDGSIYEIKLYKVDKSETYFASTKGFFTGKNITLIAVALFGLSIGLGQLPAKKKPVTE